MNNAIRLPLKELKTALAGLGKVVSKTFTLPIIQAVRLDRDEKGIVTLQVTDLDNHITCRLDQPQEGKPTTVIVPFKELLSLSKTVTGIEQIEASQPTAQQAVLGYTIGSTPMEHKAEAFRSDEWPTPPEAANKTIPLGNEFRQSLLQALGCASHDSTRYVINGAYVDVSDKRAHYLVGTDGKHLFAANSFDLPLKDSLIIPNMKFLGWSGLGEDGDWKMAVLPVQKKDQPVKIQFQTDHWTVTVKTLEGQFPNWRNCVPSDAKTIVEFEPQGVEFIQRVAPRMPGFDGINQPIGLSVKGNHLALMARNNPKEDWTEVPVPGVKIEGKAVTIHVNRSLLLKAFDFGLTRLELENNISALKFRNRGKQMIVMPVRCEDAPVASKQSVPATQPAATAPAAQPQPPTTATTERKTIMPKGETQTSTNGTALNKAIQQVETAKDALKEVVHGLNDVLDTLKLAQKEQKTADREIDSVRSTIKTLQKVQI